MTVIELRKMLENYPDNAKIMNIEYFAECTEIEYLKNENEIYIE